VSSSSLSSTLDSRLAWWNTSTQAAHLGQAGAIQYQQPAFRPPAERRRIAGPDVHKRSIQASLRDTATFSAYVVHEPHDRRDGEELRHH
jgi:hypothetical protein